MPAEHKKPHLRWLYMSTFERSYTYKLGFYIMVLALPMLIMAVVETLAAGSAISVSGGNPSRFLAFLIYFLPGLIITKNTTDSWRRTLGIGIAYALISPAYYIGAVELSCKLGANCVSV
jgi:hypothetical protein